MNELNSSMILEAMAKHETLTEGDIAKEENLGIEPDHGRLVVLLQQLVAEGYLALLADVTPATYTITNSGVAAAAAQQV